MAITRFGRGEMLAGTALANPTGTYNYYLQAVSLTDSTGADIGTAGNPLVVSSGTGTSSNQVQGTAARAATATGNPLRSGGVNSSADPAYTNGQIGDLRLDNAGRLFVAAGSRTNAADGAANVVFSMQGVNDSTSGNFSMLWQAGMVFNGTSWDRQRGDTTGTYTVSKGSGSLATNQVSVGTTAGGTQVVAARTGRTAVTIKNLGTTDVFIGVSGVTTTSGFLLEGVKGASLTIPTSAAVFAIVGTGTQTVSFFETF